MAKANGAKDIKECLKKPLRSPRGKPIEVVIAGPTRTVINSFQKKRNRAPIAPKTGSVLGWTHKWLADDVHRPKGADNFKSATGILKQLGGFTGRKHRGYDKAVFVTISP